MTQNEFRKLERELFRKYTLLDEEIYRKAVSEGKWRMGLDSNRDLFRQANDDLKRELEELYKNAGFGF